MCNWVRFFFHAILLLRIIDQAPVVQKLDNAIHPLSSAEASLRRGEAGEKEKESARGYPEGASAEERAIYRLNHFPVDKY